MWKTTAPVMKSLLAWVTPIMGNLSLLQVLTFYKAAIIVFSFFFFKIPSDEFLFRDCLRSFET